jgi:hypothetical protein
LIVVAIGIARPFRKTDLIRSNIEIVDRDGVRRQTEEIIVRVLVEHNLADSANVSGANTFVPGLGKFVESKRNGFKTLEALSST